MLTSDLSLRTTALTCQAAVDVFSDTLLISVNFKLSLKITKFHCQWPRSLAILGLLNLALLLYDFVNVPQYVVVRCKYCGTLARDEYCLFVGYVTFNVFLALINLKVLLRVVFRLTARLRLFWFVGKRFRSLRLDFYGLLTSLKLYLKLLNLFIFCFWKVACLVPWVKRCALVGFFKLIILLRHRRWLVFEICNNFSLQCRIILVLMTILWV